MAKLKSNFRNMMLVLSGITLFAALTLSSVYTLTKEPIALSKIAKQQDAIKDVLPPYDHFDAKPIEKIEGSESTKVYRAYDRNNNFIGSAVESSTITGYKGHVGIIVGFDKGGKIINYVVLNQNETPGLGAKMVNWFKTDKGNQNIIGLNPLVSSLTLKKVDGITGATISSNAFLGAVQSAYDAHSANIPDQKK